MLSIAARATVISPACFDFSHVLLHSIPKLLVNDRLMLSANDKGIRIIKVTTALSLRVPAEHTDIDRIAQNIFYGAIFKWSSAMGSDTLRVQPSGNTEKTFSGCKAFEYLPNERCFGFVLIELLML